MASIGDIRAWLPGELDSAFDALSARRDSLIGLDDELLAARVPDGWTGKAATAATAAHGALSERARRIVAGISAVRRATGEASDAVSAIQRGLAEAEDLARAYGFAVCGDGTVIDVHPPTIPDPAQAQEVQRERAQVQAEVVDRLEQILRRANDVDADFAAVLGRAARGEIDDGTGLSLAAAAAIGDGAGRLSTIGPPDSGTPGDNAGWWASLSDEERRALIDQNPGALGNLDGLPAAVRDEANRARLDDERAALEAERDRLQADLDDNWFGGVFTNADAALEDVNAKLASLDRIEQTLDQPGERQLLALDLSGERAEAAVAVGNVDTADHVAVFTPGLGSTVDGDLQRYDDNMDQLRRQAQYESNRYGDGGSVAAVTWIGYQAPQPGFGGFNPLDSDSVLHDDSARAGGADLAEFYRGIDASRATNPHLTALGHSYGSTTTGFALQERTGVDDAVFFGSPGIGTSHIEDIQVTEGHSYRIEARNDFVADTGHFGIDPTHVDGLTGLSAREETLADGRRLAESTGHSGYLTPDSTSHYNLSVVVAGLPNGRVEDSGRGLGDIGSWPIPATY
ncbi:MAG: alpha/beta hydrolase family protein [Actinomycetota bacterium]|nr:alpha/beta hydrolase family protein [Actinomycetota bacterium]